MAKRTLLGVSYLTVATSASWGGSTERVHNFIFQDKNPRSNFNWLYLAVVLLKALFRESELAPG
jgi:hypothetical protein